MDCDLVSNSKTVFLIQSDRLFSAVISLLLLVQAAGHDQNKEALQKPVSIKNDGY